MYIGQDRKIGGTSVPPAPLASLAPFAILENCVISWNIALIEI